MSARPRQVLILIGQLGRGGAERQVHELATRLPRDRFEPTVVTFEPNGHYQPLLESEGVEVLVIPKAGWREALVVPRLASLLTRRDVDLVHAFLFPANWRAVAAGRLAGVRNVICSVRSTGIWMSPRHRIMDRMAMNRASAVVANAPAVRDDVIRRTGVAPGRVHVIMNGVDTTVFHPPDAATASRQGAASPANGSRRVGFVGSLREAKDPMLFLEMARRVAVILPDVAFVVVGDGPLRHRLEETAARGVLAGRVRFEGERPDVPDMIRSFDALTVTSVREGCCNVILEAMASGIPVAATSVGGNPDLITHGRDGLLFAHGDAEAGAGALVDLLSNAGLARSVREAGLERARDRFSVAAMVRETLALYEASR